MNLTRYMIHTITVQTKGAPDRNGDRTLGTTKTVRARYEAKTDKIRTPDNTERAITGVVYTTEEIPPQSRVWVPGTDPANLADARECVFCGWTEDIRGTGTRLYKAILG